MLDLHAEANASTEELSTLDVGDTAPTYAVVEPELPESQLQALLGATESSTLEFKRVSGKMVGKAVETLCAFANTQGGTLVLGLADSACGKGRSRFYGIEENVEAVDELRRKTQTSFDPPLSGIRWTKTSVVGRSDDRVHLVMVQVPRSEHVHSIAGDGTWIRLAASNCQMTAREIVELCYRRGDYTAESHTMRIESKLLDTQAWRKYSNARGLSGGPIIEQLRRVGLAEYDGATMQPKWAAVLLFAEEPGGHLAGHLARCEIRLFVYKGTRIESRATPNFRKTPVAFTGPLIDLIEAAVRAIATELDDGVEHVGSGFVTRHRIPLRVVKEALVNAVVHRDYRLTRDIFVRVFDDRIEIESPGALPGVITVENIGRTGSKPRNPLIARTLREFPERPNVDAGEGVRMMFDEMDRAGLYPPLYRESVQAAGDMLTLVLINEPKIPLWDAVSDWIDRNGPVNNATVCQLGVLDRARAFRTLKHWTELGLLEPVPERGPRNAAYRKRTPSLETFVTLTAS